MSRSSPEVGRAAQGGCQEGGGEEGGGEEEGGCRKKAAAQQAVQQPALPALAPAPVVAPVSAPAVTAPQPVPAAAGPVSQPVGVPVATSASPTPTPTHAPKPVTLPVGSSVESVDSVPVARGSGAVLGTYTGGAPTGVAGRRAFEAWLGAPAPYALEYSPNDSWPAIEGRNWLLSPWSGSGYRLVYSIAPFPKLAADGSGGGSLETCATGAYDVHWHELGRRLVAYRLADTIVRPGWELNADWFAWAAEGHEAAFAGCFRRILSAMRTVPGQTFEFDWSVAVGPGSMVAERAWPGDGYVDHIGLDVYDASWSGTGYFTGMGDLARSAMATATWARLLEGDHGLHFWERYAVVHGARVALDEWGVWTRPDGHGGGDDPAFVERVLAHVGDPANAVAYALYFNYDASDGRRLTVRSALRENPGELRRRGACLRRARRRRALAG